MARIPEEAISRIRDAVDIVAVVGESVQLKKTGNSFRGLCPFHREKTGSFYVVPDKKFFHCFGCQKSGDVFRFVMEMQGKTFAEAVRELGRRAGIEVPDHETPSDRARRNERARFLEVNAIAAAFFREVLRGDEGIAGRKYLLSRGIGEEVADTFQLGMAPDAWDLLAKRLEARRVPMEAAVTLGLVAPRKGGRGHYDRFRNRLMCPILLPAGEVVAFSGRILGEAGPDVPKYVNSPGSPVYTKGHHLFGLHAARAEFRRKGRAILVEGNFDVIALHQAGFRETVGPLGTALTEKQVDVLRLLAPMVVLCLDGDAAGRNAALKDLPALMAAGVETRVAPLPEGEDPDTFVRKHGPEAFETLIARAQPAVEYFIHEVWGRSDRSSDRRARALREAAPVVARISDEARREIVIGELAAALDVDPRVVRRAVATSAEAPRRGNAPPKPPVPAHAGRPVPVGPTPPPPPKELKILAILADHPDLVEVAEREGARELLTDPRLRDMYSAARGGRSFAEWATPQELSDVVITEVLSGQYKSLADPARALIDALRNLRRDRLAAAVEDLDRRIKDAERRGDRVLARELVKRMIETRNEADRLRRRPEEPR